MTIIDLAEYFYADDGFGASNARCSLYGWFDATKPSSA